MNWLYTNIFSRGMDYYAFTVFFYFYCGIMAWVVIGTFVYYARYNLASWYTYKKTIRNEKGSIRHSKGDYWTRSDVESSATMWGFIWPLVLLFYVIKWVMTPVIIAFAFIGITWASFVNYIVTSFHSPRIAAMTPEKKHGD